MAQKLWNIRYFRPEGFAIVEAIGYENNPINKLPKVEKELVTALFTDGTVIFDLYSTNGNSSNRLVRAQMREGYIKRNTMEICSRKELGHQGTFIKEHSTIIIDDPFELLGLFTVSWDVDDNYQYQYRWALVCAKDEQEAISFHPSGNNDNWGDSTWACVQSDSNLTVKRIGVALRDIPRGVQYAAFF